MIEIPAQRFSVDAQIPLAQGLEQIAEGRISGDSAVDQIKRSYGIESRHPNA